MLSFFCSRFIA